MQFHALYLVGIACSPQCKQRYVAPSLELALSHFSVKFLCDCVRRQPDMALAELQAELKDAFDVEISVQTVSRTLKRAGYTMKTVRHSPLDL